MEAKVNLPMPVEKYGFNCKKLKSKWLKEVRRIRKLSSIILSQFSPQISLKYHFNFHLSFVPKLMMLSFYSTPQTTAEHLFTFYMSQLHVQKKI